MKIHFPVQLVFSLTPILPFLGVSGALTHFYPTPPVSLALESMGFVNQVSPLSAKLSPLVAQAEPPCPEPALSRLSSHQIAAGETIESIAQRYNLIPATLLGFNPVLRNGNLPVGAELRIPPYNGVQVEAPVGTSWQDLAATYNVRADALFEVNGCRNEVPRTVFIPGVNWAPTQAATTSAQSNPLQRYPLPQASEVLTSYGWQVNPDTSEVVFQSGVNLQAEAGTPVLAAGEGTIAFAGSQEGYGNLVVVNHSQGLQTRYAQLGNIAVQTGQQVQSGERLGTVGANAATSYLQFEVRSNSALGWVAQDPSEYIPEIRSADSIRRQRQRSAE
ncbi:MAG: hypothetical protein Kow00121_61840 [Elainellaceae cyanobacterium]